MTEKELHEQANEILHTFKGKQYNGKELMVVMGYVLVRLLLPIIKNHSVSDALYWLADLTKTVTVIINSHTEVNNNDIH